ncbi:MAG: LuxR family transcriptional regulator [Alphaproteobacteria bacterium]|nr:LuxR family transcriptional regulator [Alphaproteobacteria bacterium]
MDHQKQELYANLLNYNESINSTIVSSFRDLQNNYGINYFYHIKIIKNFSFFICSNLEYLKHAFANELFASRYPTFQNIVSNLEKKEVRKFLWTGNPPDKPHECIYDFGIWNGYTFYERLEDGLEAWGFGADKNNTNIVNFYINNEYNLMDYIFHLKDKYKNLFDISTVPCLIPSNLTFSNDFPNIASKESLPKKEIKKYYLTSDLSLSKRQAECIIASIKGQSAKEIARGLNLSPRSVEKYLENLKSKMGCATMREMFEKLFELESLKHLLFRSPDIIKSF